MKLIVKLLAATLNAGQAQDMSFELTLENESEKSAPICAKDIPWENDLGYHGFGAVFAEPLGKSPRRVRRPANPAWGAPSPPYLAEYRAQHELMLRPGQRITAQVQACFWPRFEPPRGNKALLAALQPPQSSDVAALSLVVFETRCAELKRALGKDPENALYGRPLIVVARGEHEVTLSYVEQAGFGFVPAQPLRLTAAPVKLRIP